MSIKQINTKQDPKLNFNEDCRCPMCGSEQLDILYDHIDNWLLEVRATCKKCKCNFSAVYTIDFSGIQWFKPDGGNLVYAQD